MNFYYSLRVTLNWSDFNDNRANAIEIQIEIPKKESWKEKVPWNRDMMCVCKTSFIVTLREN